MMTMMKYIKKIINSFRFYVNINERVEDLRFEIECLKAIVGNMESNIKKLSEKKRIDVARSVGRPRKNKLTGSKQLS